MDPVKYLTGKVRKVIPDSERIYNEGASIIAHIDGWESLIGDATNIAWDTTLKYCLKNKTSTYKAAAKLTFVSTSIGTQIAAHLGIEEPTVKTTISLGDLFIESFLQQGLVEIFREFEGRKAPYMLQIINDKDLFKPMLVGTFFNKPVPIASLRSPITKEPYIKGWTNGKLFAQYLDTRFIKSLDMLRQQPWKINRVVLDAALAEPPQKTIEIVDVETGEIVTMNIHEKAPKGTYTYLGVPFKGKTDKRLQKLISKYYEYTQVTRKACLIGKQEFYQEVSCDYRGRVYYSESFLSYQGGDLARALMMFGNEKLVTEKGFRWMCINAAVSYNQSYGVDEIPEWCTTDYKLHLQDEGLDTISVDKMTLKDRELWAKNNMVTIRSTAFHEVVDNDAEKPYSYLSGCIEIDNYLTAKARGKQYCSSRPIPSDGSNNGWQHLSAMSKDRQAGELVSLTASPIQKDFYVSVAKELVKELPEWFNERQIPMKHIRKGIAKRGSMTRAYSAGKRRIAANMFDDCYMMGFTTKYNIDEEQCSLLAGNLINAINKVCAGPLKTTKYLQKMAEHELASGRNSLSWVTPSGFPVIYKAFLQHEHKQRGTIRGIKGNKDGRVMHVIKVDVIGKDTGEKVPCRRSFASGISPNVVHSYDAAHLANTVCAFGGSFAAVHDSFSTHADDVDLLQEVAKMTFIAQYDVPNFFNTIEESMMNYRETFETEQPHLGELDISEVANSDYFFC